MAWQGSPGVPSPARLQLVPRADAVSRCPACRQDLPLAGAGREVRCDGCGVAYHGGCWRGLGAACATLGCVRFGARVWARRSARARARRRARAEARARAAEARAARSAWALPRYVGLSLTSPLLLAGQALGLPLSAVLGLAWLPLLCVLLAEAAARHWSRTRKESITWPPMSTASPVSQSPWIAIRK